jgi:4-aminobutyrate aminotransferase-like enzyme
MSHHAEERAMHTMRLGRIDAARGIRYRTDRPAPLVAVSFEEAVVSRSPEELLRLKSDYVIPCVKHYYERPMNLVRGRMQYLEDSDGRQYLDFFAGILTVNCGHANPEINAALHAQIDKLCHLSTVYLMEPMLEYAAELAHITPGDLRKSFFCNSGTEAIDTALLTAKLATGCEDVVALRHSYHGRSHVAIGVSGLSTWRPPVAPMGNVHFTAAAYCYRCPFGLEYPSCDVRCARDLENVIQSSTSGRLAAFIAEPIQGVGGIVTPPPEFFPIVYEIVKRYGGITIADEVQGAWGRTGTHLFSIEHWGVQPDMMVFAKAMANGLAVGAFIARAEIADAYKGPNISTFGGNPLAMVAAIASLKYIREHDLAGNAARLGALLRDGLLELQAKHPLIGEVRGKGLMVGVELVLDRKTKAPAPAAAAQVMELCKDDGVLVGRGGYYNNVLRLTPPLVITADDVRRALTSLDKALGAVERDLTFA